MKIAIDLQACQTDSRARGIGRYAFSLATAMARLKPPGWDVTFLHDLADPERVRDLRARLRGACAASPSALYGYPGDIDCTDRYPALVHGAGVLKSGLLKALGFDTLLVSSFFEAGGPFTTHFDWDSLKDVRKVVVAYDLIPALFPDRYLPPGQFLSDWYRGKLEAFKRFDLFLAISEATKRDLITHLGIHPDRVRVIGAGLDEGFDKGRDEVCEFDALGKRLGISKPYVLMVGNADWRKNSLGALLAFAALPKSVRDAHQLVFTRVGDDVVTALHGEYAHLRRNVVVAGTVSEAELRMLYRCCKLFFFPSLYEGFGLPVLEAMALEAPVLCADSGALPEVVHRSEILFDPNDADAMVAALCRALTDEGFRSTIAAGARDHALSFSWDRAADRAMSAMAELASSRSPASAAWEPSEREIALLADVVEHGPEAESAMHQSLQVIAAARARRLLVDITEIVRLDNRSGIQRVVRNYCAGLLDLAASQPDVEVEPICWTELGIVHPRTYVRERLGIAIHGDDEMVEARPGDVAFMVDSSWWSPERFDAFHADVHRLGGEVVWMVYDLVPIRTPHYCDPGLPPVFAKWLQHVGATADGVVCISEATRLDLEAYFDESNAQGASRPWTSTVHLGSDLESGATSPTTEPGRAVLSALGQRSFALAIGTVEPRKDYATVLDAFEAAWSGGSPMALTIVGKAGWNVDGLIARITQHPERGKRLFWLASASDGDIRELLGKATVLVQASRLEGFGLPVVEAGSEGVPLLLSDIPVFREIAGDEAEYFEPGNAHSLASQLLVLGERGWRRPSCIRTMTWLESSRRMIQLLLPGASQV